MYICNRDIYILLWLKYRNYGMIAYYACCISFFSQCLCYSMPASGSTPVAFLLSLKNCSAELILSSMVQCSVVCCTAADMSNSSLLPSSLLSFPLDSLVWWQKEILQLQSSSLLYFLDCFLPTFCLSLFFALIITSPFIFVFSSFSYPYLLHLPCSLIPSHSSS